MNRTSAALPGAYLFPISELNSVSTPHTEKPIRNYVSRDHTFADQLGWLSKYSPYNFDFTFSFFHLSKRKCERIQSGELTIEEVLARKVKQHRAITDIMGQPIPLFDQICVSTIKLNPPHKIGALEYLRSTNYVNIEESTLCSYLQKYRFQTYQPKTSDNADPATSNQPRSAIWHRSSKKTLNDTQLHAKAEKYADMYVKLAITRQQKHPRNPGITAFVIQDSNIKVIPAGVQNSPLVDQMVIRLAFRDNDTNANQNQVIATHHSMIMLFKEAPDADRVRQELLSPAAKLSYQKLIILSFLTIFLYWLFFAEQTTPNKN